MATLLLAGTPQTTVGIAHALTQAHHTILGVLCPFPKPIGRKALITPCALEIWANEHHIPVFHVDKERIHTTLQNELATIAQPDLLVVADFGFLIPPWLLHHAKRGSINVHPSLLPRWRGATPVPFTILFGDKETGVTIIEMNEQFDKGGILAQAPVPILPTDTTPTLLHRAFEVGATLLVKIIPAYLEGTRKAQEQTPSPTPLTRKFTKDDGYIPYQTLEETQRGSTPTTPAPLLQSYTIPTTAETVDRMIRALTPWPGTWTITPEKKRMKILHAELLHTQPQTLKLTEVQYEGKTAQKL